MNLVELTRYTNDGKRAETYLMAQGILKTFNECPYFHGTRFNRIRRFKSKYYSCNRKWKSVH